MCTILITVSGGLVWGGGRVFKTNTHCYIQGGPKK